MSNETLNTSIFQEEENDSNLKEIVYKYLVHWKWFVLSLALALCCAYVYKKYQVPIYSAQASILLKSEKSGMGQDEMLKMMNISSSNKVVDNEIEILKSYGLMEKVVKSLNLNVSYYRKKRFKDAELYDQSPVRMEVIQKNEHTYGSLLDLKLINSQKIELNGVTIPLNTETSTPYGVMKITLTGQRPDLTNITVSIQPVMDVAENIASSLDIETSSKMSSVLVLSLNDAVAQRAKDVLNTLMKIYNTDGLADKNKANTNTLAFIEDRLKLISGDLAVLEKNIEDYKSGQGITDFSKESEMFMASVQAKDMDLNKIKIQQLVIKNIEEYVSKKKNLPGTVPSTMGIEDPVFLKLLEQLSELEGQRERIINLSKADNPLILALDEQIDGIKKDLLENIQSIKTNLNLMRQQVEGEIDTMEAEIKLVPGKERTLVDITRQQTIKNNLYVFLLEKKEETELAFAASVSDTRIIDAASSSGPINPMNNVYSYFTLLGLAIPFGIILTIDLLYDKIKNRREIEKGTKAPVFGEVSFVKHKEAIVINSAERSIISEQIRVLRTNLSFLTPNKTPQSILLTSSISKEGKSFISLNLGASLALTDKKTIILELDMRNPKLHGALHIPNTKGLSNYFLGKAELKDIIIPIPGHPNYFMITCGPIPPNPVELLITDRLTELFTELRKQFNYIIIDSPPLGLVTDAQILEKQADATIYVMRHVFTPKKCIEFVNNLYKEKKFKNLNIVFNAITEDGMFGYGHGYGYGYGYGHGYGHDQQEKPSWNLLKRFLLRLK